MSQRHALTQTAWQAARAAGFPFLEVRHGFSIARGPRPWHRFLEQAGNADLRAAVAALDRLHHA
jgi:hypothetical protein